MRTHKHTQYTHTHTHTNTHTQTHTHTYCTQHSQGTLAPQHAHKCTRNTLTHTHSHTQYVCTGAHVPHNTHTIHNQVTRAVCRFVIVPSYVAIVVEGQRT